MDGFKRRLNDSIQFKLSFSLILAIVLVALAAGAFSYASAFDEANELQDATLDQIADLIDRGHGLSLPTRPHQPARPETEEARVTVQMLPAQAQPALVGQHEPVIPARLTEGFHTLALDGKDFRVLVKILADGQRVGVAQETSVRDETARDSALRTLLPLLVLVPVLLITVARLVKKMLQPMEALAMEIDRRAEHDLTPLGTERLPSELRPFASAINGLLSRVSQSMEAQRRFLADAAHELRSPLAAMSLQSERLQQSSMSNDARDRLSTLRAGIERGRKLLEQLLTLARTQASEFEPGTGISVQGTFREVIEALMPLAEDKDIDLGVSASADAWLKISPLDLFTMVKNLADNAIRYTPAGGTVDLSIQCTDTTTVLRVIDSGPGIRPEERTRVFSPFYRTLGSREHGAGLGLAIVQTIADRYGAVVSLEHADLESHAGLCVSVVFPSLAARASKLGPQ